MATPKSVQRQLDQADALLKAQAEATEAQPQLVTTAEQLTAPPPPAPAPEAPPPTPTAAPDPGWEQKFRTLQGMYQAEVPNLKTQVRTYESELVAMKEQLRALTAAAQKATEQPPQKPPPDPRDVESFGADMIDMVQRYAQQVFTTLQNEASTRFTAVDQRLQRLEESLTGVSQKTETTLETQFYAALTGLVPDWKTVNVSNEWLAWLAEVDSVYRVPRQAALDAAHKRGDVEGVAAVFNAFKTSRPAKPSADLASQVSPSGGASSAPPVQAPDKRIISRKFVHNFYTDIAKGKYKGREAEIERIEAEINKAAAESRIA